MAYYFNLPIITDLTPSQQLVVNEVDPIAVSGGPGTGKTVVNLWRHIYNHEKGGKKSLLLTYTKTLEHYLKATAATKNKSASNHIDRTYRWTYNSSKEFYDEIIIDEAQDVELERYYKVKKQCNDCSYGADDAQSLYPDKHTSLDQLRDLFGNNEEYELDKNFRNSREILLFTKAAFPNHYIPQQVILGSRSTGILPIELNIGWEFEDCVDQINEIISQFSSNTHNIGILVPGRNQVSKYFEALEEDNTISKYEGEMTGLFSIENIHVTTYKSSKGLEFDTVIIPDFDSYKWYINNTSNTSENDYYVALTRAKTNLFLITKNSLTGIDTSTYETE
ncbi:DUF2075 domain-containing protein [Salegentibacter sp. JZCK2]|uniref:3'-5' exonuclease n=1 Tax=Salegentibacter tibetensis TaxID=2873600 RepID=UPI001CCA46FC|nr:3'-5' exonuclease [Salegentibacter tibetensis]MBZ9730883.1 DUF2075 domain-containing protein [Salegentibacter tibetensis]